MQKQKNFPFTKNETILQRTETKQSNHSAIWHTDIHQNRKIEQINNFLPCSSGVACTLYLSKPYYFTVKVEAGVALSKDVDPGRQCLWLLLLIAERRDNEGFEEPSYLQDWLLIFLFSPSWTLSDVDVACGTFVSFRPGGRTQLQRRPSHKGAQLKLRRNAHSLFWKRWTHKFCLQSASTHILNCEEIFCISKSSQTAFLLPFCARAVLCHKKHASLSANL